MIYHCCVVLSELLHKEMMTRYKLMSECCLKGASCVRRKKKKIRIE